MIKIKRKKVDWCAKEGQRTMTRWCEGMRERRPLKQRHVVHCCSSMVVGGDRKFLSTTAKLTVCFCIFVKILYIYWGQVVNS